MTKPPRGSVTVDPEALYRHRKASKLTQAKLATAAQVSHSMIEFIEAGVRQPSVDTLHRIAAALGVEATEIATIAEVAA